MDDTDAAALIRLGEQPKWTMDKLPAGIDTDLLRCLDADGLIEVRHRYWQNTQQHPSDPPSRVETPHRWFSPIGEPGAGGSWEQIASYHTRHNDHLPFELHLSERGLAAATKVRRSGTSAMASPSKPRDEDANLVAAACFALAALANKASRLECADDKFDQAVEAARQALENLPKAPTRELAEAVVRLKAEALTGFVHSVEPGEPGIHHPQTRADIKAFSEWQYDLRVKAHMAPEPPEPTTNASSPSVGAGTVIEAKPVGKGMRWQEARKAAEAHVKRNPWPGVNVLASIIGCAPSTMSKAIKKSSRLKVKRAEAERHGDNSVRAAGLADPSALPDPHSSSAPPRLTQATDDLLMRLVEAVKPSERVQMREQLMKMSPENLAEYARMEGVD